MVNICVCLAQTLAAMKEKFNVNRLRFILLDDDLVALAIAAKVIRNHSRRAEIIPFTAAREAIAYMEAEDFSSREGVTVLLADLHMPETDAFSLLDRMENRFLAMWERLHVFVLSGAACPDEIRKLFTYRYVNGFISKPFDKDKMAHILNCIQYPL
jgi:response regulator RpfG family c-di-GMP phosphodiesterase